MGGWGAKKGGSGDPICEGYPNLYGVSTPFVCRVATILGSPLEACTTCQVLRCGKLHVALRSGGAPCRGQPPDRREFVFRSRYREVRTCRTFLR